MLSIRNIAKRFPMRGRQGSESALIALDDVSLEVSKGEIVAIVGESGSGKSTLARIVARLLRADEGAIELDGEDVPVLERRRPPLLYRQRVQMIFQDPFGSLNPVNRVGYHIARPLQRHGLATKGDVREKTIRLLESVGLSPGTDFVDRFPHELSGGQRQRVAIARALAPNPSLVLADEPTSMLDVSVRMDVLKLLRALRDERGLTFLLITHDLASARQLADRFVVLYRGQVVETADTDTIINDAKHPYTRRLIGAAPGGSWNQPKGPSKSAAETASGCKFAAHCQIADEQCVQARPTLNSISDSVSHNVACFHWGDQV